MRMLTVAVCIAAVFAAAQADSLNCRLVGAYDTPGNAEGVVVAGGYAYVADYTHGLKVIEFYGGAGLEQGPVPSEPCRLPGVSVVRGVLMLPRDMTELPGNSDRVPRSALLDATGRKVMELVQGENDVRHLAPGVYFVRMANGEWRTANSKVVVAR